MQRNTLFLLPLLLSLLTFSQKPYFQQEVNYIINVRLDDSKHELFADERIEYINNSPDKLTFIWFHLWPNAYKDNSTALAKQLLENGGTEFYYAKKKDRGYIDQLEFKVNGLPAEVVYHKEWIDVCQIFLTTPLGPGEKVIITTPFHVKIPLGIFSRMGHIEEQYQITQWYPKPAVYDKNGWHPMPYLDQGEFYSEFGSFDASITVPENYVVGATGDLINGEKETEWLNKIADETAKKDFEEKVAEGAGKKMVLKPKYTDEYPPSSAFTKTLRYKQSKVHDFAWFCDKRYNVLKSEVELPHSKRKVTTWLMFTNGQSKLWKDAMPYINDAIYYYSKWNGDYPYNHATAVDGALSAGGGMEYPNITVIGAANDGFELETVIMHEVGHNWFYGILGSNERLHPWMDEGINSFNELRYIETKYPENCLLSSSGNVIPKLFGLEKYPNKLQYYYFYMINGARRLDQPVEGHSAEFTQVNYGGIVYSKTAVVFDYLKAYLGDEVMDQGMRLYFDTWKFRHPYPEDLQFCLEKSSGKDLSWFFGDVIQTNKRIDFKVTGIGQVINGTDKVYVRNTGEMKAPAMLYGINKNDTVGTLIGWSDLIEPGSSYVFDVQKEYDHYAIDPYFDIPEINRNNNAVNKKGLFKKTEKPQIRLLGTIDDPHRSQLFVTPLTAWNYYNGIMGGVAFYNNIFPEKKFEYVIAPMFGLRNKELCGSYELALNLRPKKLLQHVRLVSEGKHFAYTDFPFAIPRNFTKLKASVEIQFKKKRLRSNISHHLDISGNFIMMENFSISMTGPQITFNRHKDTTIIQQLTYYVRFPHAIHGWNTGFLLEHSADHMKFEFRSNFQYRFLRGKRLAELRFYAAKLFGADNAKADKFALRLSGSNGSHDYMFNGNFLGRSEHVNFLSQQFIGNNGGFRTLTNVGENKNWIATLNFRSGIPLIPWFKVFADAGFIPNDSLNNYAAVQYDAGVGLSIFRGALEIYMPLLYSADIKNAFDDSDRKGLKLLSFTLDLSVANPFRLIREAVR